MGPGPSPLGPWGASRGAWAVFPGSLGRLPGGPWEGSRPNVLGPEGGEPSWFWHRFFITILISIFDRLGVDLNSVLGVIFGRFGALVGQS
jgi:hypothetical protein